MKKDFSFVNESGEREHFRTTPNGVIIEPGRFEGEMYYAPYYYDLSLSGFADSVEFIGDTQVDIFNLSFEDWDKFPELKGCEMLELWVDGNGFVSVNVN